MSMFEAPGCNAPHVDPFSKKTVLLEIAMAAVPAVITIVAQKLVEEISDHFKRARHSKKDKGDKDKGDKSEKRLMSEGDMVDLDDDDVELLQGADGQLYAIIDGVVYPAKEVAAGPDGKPDVDDEPAVETPPAKKKPTHRHRPSKPSHKPSKPSSSNTLFRGMNEIG